MSKLFGTEPLNNSEDAHYAILESVDYEVKRLHHRIDKLADNLDWRINHSSPMRDAAERVDALAEALGLEYIRSHIVKGTYQLKEDLEDE